MGAVRRGAWAALCIGAAACIGNDPAPTRTQPARPHAGGPVIGTNLAPMSDWSSEPTSVNLFKGARPWVSGTEEEFRDERRLDLDEDGWVRSLQSGQVARTLMLSDGARYPTGDYLVTYEGSGTFEFFYSGKTERVASDGTGRITLTVTRGQGGFSLAILKTQPSDYLRNIHIIMPGGVCEDARTACDAQSPCEEGSCTPFTENHAAQVFYPEFLASLEGYSVLRFMDWMQTNDSTQVRYADRPSARLASWAIRGVPVETMVELANRSGRDAWFCMPHAADDLYVERFAQYVRDHLGHGRRAYVEYSNEVWNGQFAQADYARQQGIAAGLGENEFESQLHFYARRTTEVHKIWSRVFQGQTERIVRVMASQADNSWVSSTQLEFEDAAKHTDVLAIAPYFGSGVGRPDELARVEEMDLDTLMLELKSVDVPQVVQDIADQARVAAEHKLELIAYEGGQHLAGIHESAESDRLNTLFDAANRDPRMKDLYAEYLRGWRASGGHTFVHFNSCGMMSKYGRWGAREWLQQPRDEAPKLDAILEFSAQNPRWW